MTSHTGAAAGDRRRATIEDVAAAAGVSVATVSRAIRGLPNVALSTRERVAKVADELSYRADPAAARLATGRAQSVGVVVPLLNCWYFSQVVSGAEAILAAEGYDMIVIGVTGDAERHALFDDNRSIHRRVDGLVFVDVPLSGDDTSFLADRQLAVVTVGNSTSRFPSIGIDDVAVGELAADHLLQLGHTRIGVIGGQCDDPLGFHVPDLRRTGYERALRRAGITVDPALEVVGNFSVLGGRDATDTLLAADEPPTAVFAMSDEMAFGAVLSAREHGLDVPGDVSIIGVDDHDVSVVIGLTTVRQPVADHGARAARLVIEQLTGRSVGPTRVERPVELVVRSTTAPPAPSSRATSGGHRPETSPKLDDTLGV
jgi:LacI family transcriptional regulator, repressor for deo operon, udp, cdd, tsx, nupC, and nupG